MSATALISPDRPEVSIGWLLRHELRLSFRDWQAMVTAGHRRRFGVALIILLLVAVGLHVPAYAIVARFGTDGVVPDKSTLISVSLILALYISLLLSQAMESVTRTLYSRGDLDLVMSSPISPLRLFAVRIVTQGLLISVMALVLSAPLIDVLVISGGPRWLVAYGVAISFGFVTASLAVAITIGLFRILGPRRTRIVAQIIAAVIGAAFAIGLQVIAIVYYGTFTQRVFVASPETIAATPSEDSLVWLPARAVLGDLSALGIIAAVAVLILTAVVVIFAPRLGEHSIAATDIAAGIGKRRHVWRAFRSSSPASAMRRKEWLLLRRDPWLVSQTLAQLLYLAPPALLLARNFGNATGVLVIVVMVLCTVGGQLAGALAWLAISGEDAPDMVATAPVSSRAVTRAKIEAVMGAIAIVLGPLVVGLAFLSTRHAMAAAIGLALAAASTIRIQLWFRAQAKRSHFRRRHTSSRIATFGEALVSFSWAAAAGLAVTDIWLSGISVVIALVILAGVRSVSPRKAALP